MTTTKRANNYADAILHFLKGKEVEVYCGDTGTTLKFADSEETQKNVIRGTIEDALGDCVVVRVSYRQKSALVYLNTWSIKAILPLEDGLFMMDIYDDEEFNLRHLKKR